MLDFFNKVLPQNGHYVAWVKNEKYSKNYTFSTLQQLAQYTSILDNQNESVYFALASFKEELNEKMRTTVNVQSYKSLWADIDVDPANDDKYNSQLDVVKHLKVFLKETGLPSPMIVSSGDGIHLYWALDKEIDLGMWYDMSTMMIQVSHHFKFKVDVAALNKATQVLRAPGTYHKKNPSNPKLVRVLKDAPVYKLADIKTPLVKTITDNEIEAYVAPRHSRVDLFRKMIEDAGWSYNPVMELRNAEPIIEGCKQMRIASGKDEPVWRAMLSIIRLCENGRDIAHELSSLDPRYSERDTDYKLNVLDEQQGESGMPTTCANFKLLNPTDCENCTANVTSPIVLGIPERNTGEISLSATGVVNQLDPMQGTTLQGFLVPPTELPSLQYAVTTPGGQFVVTEGGVVINKTVENEDGSKGSKTESVCKQRLYPIKFLYDINEEGNKEYYYLWQIENNGITNQCLLSPEVFHNNSKVVTELSKFGVIITNQKHFSVFGQFMRTFINNIQSDLQLERMYPTLGWQDNGDLVIGQNTVLANGSVIRSVLSAEAQSEASQAKMTPIGDIGKWLAAINVFNEPGQLHAQVSICASYGSLLMPYVGVRGLLLSLQGKSGVGKSTIQEACASIWGEPKAQLKAAPGTSRGSSQVSMIRSAGMFKNIPMMLEEITNMPNDTVSDFVYSVSLGSEKSRMKQSANGNYINKAGLDWESIFISSSNQTVRDKLSGAKVQFEAESMRVFEITNLPLVSDGVIDNSAVLNEMHSNYGHGGLIFARYLQSNRTNLKKWVDDEIKSLDGILKSRQSERFWLQGIAVMIVGGEIAFSAGLHQYDMEKVRKYLIEQYREQRAVTNITNDYSSTVFSEMLNSLLGEALIINTLNANIDTYEVLSSPKLGKLTMRVELDKHRGYITASRIREWANKNSLSMGMVLENGVEEGYIQDATKRERVTLSRGVSGLTSGGRTSAYEFKLKEEEIAIIKQGLGNDDNERQSDSTDSSTEAADTVGGE